MFQPNNLSRTQPEFAPSNDKKLHAEVCDLLKEHYGFSSIKNLNIAHFVGANISSQNLRISTDSHNWFLKSRSESLCAQLVVEVRLTRELAQLKIRVPSVIGSVAKMGNKCWVLYEFQEGHYFTGGTAELKAAAATFAELTAAASQIGFIEEAANEFEFLDELIELLSPESINQSNDPTVKENTATHRTRILGAIEQAKAQQSVISRECLPLHLDYHPLNLLLNDSEIVCILDLEHLKTYSVVAGLGFAAFKMIRQALVDQEFRSEELKTRAAVRLWIDAWQERFPRQTVTEAELGIGARYRILRLIHMILNATLKRGDDRSNYDLPKQIHSLYETDVMFSS